MNKFKCWKIDKKSQTNLQKELRKKYYNKDILNIVIQIFISAALFLVIEYLKSKKYFTLLNTFFTLLQMFIPIYIVEVLRLFAIFKKAYYEYSGTIDELYYDLEIIDRNPKASCKNIVDDIKKCQKSFTSIAFCFNCIHGMNAYNCFVNRLYNFTKCKYELCLAVETNKSVEVRKTIYNNLKEHYNYINDCKLCRIDKFKDFIEKEYKNSYELIYRE